MLISLAFTVLLLSANLAMASEHLDLKTLKFETGDSCSKFNDWLSENVNKNELFKYDGRIELLLTAAKHCQRNELSNLDPETFRKVTDGNRGDLEVDKYLEFLLKTGIDPDEHAVLNLEHCFLDAAVLICLSFTAVVNDTYEDAIRQYKAKCDFWMTETLGILRIFGREDLPPILKTFVGLSTKDGYQHGNPKVNGLVIKLFEAIQDYCVLYPVEKHSDNFIRLMKETYQVVETLRGKIPNNSPLGMFNWQVLGYFLDNNEAFKDSSKQTTPIAKSSSSSESE